MTTVRSAKKKGSQFEYDTHASLKQKFPDILLTKQQGFQQQFDLVSHTSKMAVECKRLKSLSWEQAKKYFIKLKERIPPYYIPYLVFKANHQPCLVMSHGPFGDHLHVVMEFEKQFQVPFIKHDPVRK